MSLPNPLLIWSLALVALALGLRTRARSAPARPSAVPLLIRIGCAVPTSMALVARLPAGRVARSIEAAGLPPSIEAVTLSRARVGLATAGLLAGLLLTLAGPAGALVGALAAIGGYLAPARWVTAVARHRRAQIVRDLPDLIDLVVLCTESGLALEPSIRLAAERLPGPLAAEVGRTLRELDLGTPRREAYTRLSRRIDAPALTGFVGALLQADELGAPMAGVLRRQAELLRAGRRQDIREHAARAAPKVQLVVAMVMVPAALLVVIGVLVIQLVGQIGGVVGGAA